MSNTRLIGFAALLFAVGSAAPAHAQPASAAAPLADASSQAAQGSKSADKALAKRVRRALGKSSGMVLTNINIRAKDGVITLRGSVPLAALIDQATQVAAGVNGVTAVANHLTVRIDPRTFNGQ